MKNLQKLHSYLREVNPYTQDDALLLSAIVKLSQVAGINKISVSAKTINNPAHTTPANIYGITFLDSGQGKDKPLRDIDQNIIKDIRNDFYDRTITYKNTKAKHVRKEADEKFGERNTAEKSKYISTNAPRFLPLEISDATLEGFIATREAHQDAGFGGTFLKISEFGDYITSNNDRRMEFLSTISDVYDYGDNPPKMIKGEKECAAVSDVPSSLMFHTSPAGLIEGRNREKLFTFLNRGLARRSFICYPEKLNRKITRETSNIMRDHAKKYLPDLIRAFRDMYYFTKKDHDDVLSDILDPSNAHNVFTFTSEADRIIEEYEIENQNNAQDIVENTDEAGLKSEMAGRHWKVLKLAGLLAAFEHPDKKTVEVEDVEEAIHICTVYSEQVQRFYKARPTDNVDMLYNYLFSNMNTWVTTMEVRNQNFVHKDKFVRWFEESLMYIDEKAEKQGYILENKKHGRSGQQYRLTTIVGEDKTPQDKTITISQAQSNEVSETVFAPIIIPFTDLHTITGQAKAWSATTFKNDYRKDENATGEIGIVALDIDGELPIKDCIARIKQYEVSCLIHTTKSHGKQKDAKPACDRYRIIFPLHHAVTLDKETFSRKIEAVARYFDLPFDRATRNISRLWFGNPAQKYKYYEGGCIDLEVFDLPKVQIGTGYIKHEPSLSHGIVAYRIKNWEKYGGRNSALYGIRRHLEEEQVEKSKIDSIVSQANSMFNPPLDEKELKIILRDNEKNNIN